MRSREGRIGTASLSIASTVLTLMFSAASMAQVSPGDILINEFVATNQDGLTDEDGDFEDWIEVENQTGAALSLNGLYLTDDQAHLLKWAFPNIVLPANSLLVIFASDKDRAPLAGELHANFKVDRNGEYVAIVDSASTVIDEILTFPEQFPGFSYGFDSGSGQFRYLQPPTPGAPNNTSTAFQGFLEDIIPSLPATFYPSAINVTLFHPDVSAQVYYTIDGSTPTTSSSLASGPIPITQTTALRARAFRAGWVDSKIMTRTYFINENESIKSLPVISVVTSPDNLCDPDLGIFTNPFMRGRAWERPGNLELVHPDGTPGFNVPCGFRLHGSDSARDGIQCNSKNQLRVYFREVYGLNRLEYPLIPRAGLTSFKRLVLRAGKNDDINPFIKDEFVRRSFQDTGNISSQGVFAQLFINGVYRGHYNPVERLDDDFMRDHHGGNGIWDVIRQGNVAADGVNTRWLEMVDFAQNNDLSIPANYEILAASLNVVNFIDYLLPNIWGATWDWPNNNWTAAGEQAPGAKFRFYVWDAEGITAQQGFTFNNFTDDFNVLGDTTAIPSFYRALVENASFQNLWAQRVRHHFFGNGALTDANLRKRWVEMRDKVSGVTALRTLGSEIPVPWIERRPIVIFNHMFEEQKNIIQPLNDLEPGSAPLLAINEFQAINNSTITDESGEFDDWIEIYNLTGNVVDLSGMFLTDDLGFSTKWEIPFGTTIDPFDYLLIWADNDPGQGPLHATFRLAGEGEEIGLFDTIANGNGELDSVKFPLQTADVSVGRRPDGVGAFVPLSLASPGSGNGTSPPVSRPDDFWVKEVFAVGPGLRDVAIGDVDKDNDLDLVATDHDFGRVAVLLNSGPNTRTFEAPRSFPAALGCRGIDLVDLDKDTYPDIVTANAPLLEYSVSVLMNNQDGTFAPAVQIPLYNMTLSATEGFVRPLAVECEDLNGDTFPDVVVSNEAPFGGQRNFVSILMNDGAGNLLGPVQFDHARFTADSFFKNLALEDIDGDSDIDIVGITDFRALSLLHNQGAGSFDAPVETGTGLNFSLSIAPGDFNGDNQVDFATTDGGTLFHVFLNAGGGVYPEGDFFFSPTSRRLEVLTACDVDLDGDEDLAMASSTKSTGDGPGVHILVNTGTGEFVFAEDGYQVTTPDEEVRLPQAIRCGDLDNDGRPDLVVTDGMSGNLTVYYNQVRPPTASVAKWDVYQ